MSEKDKDIAKAALKYDQGIEKIDWSLLPVESVEGMLRVLMYGRRKYTICLNCKTDGKPTKIYPNPRLIDGDPSRDDCPKCSSKNILSGSNNWRKGFTWCRLIAAAYRHLSAILCGEDIDPDSLEPHADCLACMVAFLSSHQKLDYGEDDRWKPPE